MDDERTLGRLEAMIQGLVDARAKDAADFERRILHLQSSVHGLTNEVTALKKKTDTLIAQIEEVEGTALDAQRRAQDSVVKLDVTTSQVFEHLSRSEESREAADKQHSMSIDEIKLALIGTEKQRRLASQQHSDRFKEQNDAIKAIASGVSAERKSRSLALIMIPLAVVAFQQLIELGKFAIAAKYQYTPSSEVKK